MTTHKKMKAIYITDFGIKIYAPKSEKNYWRISYVDQQGKLRDTTATSEKLALDKSIDIEKLLRNNAGNLPHNKVSEMISEYVNAKTKIHSGGRAEWGAKHKRSQLSIFSNHVLGTVGQKKCINLTNDELVKIIDSCETVDLRDHVATSLSALIRWGCAKGWLLQNSEMLLSDLNKIAKRKVMIAGESKHHVDKREIPTHEKVAAVAKAAAQVTDIWWYELMFNLAAYSGLRFGEICDLDLTSIDLNRRRIIVDFQCLSDGGNKSRQLPKWDKKRTTIFPEITPNGYKLKANLKKRIKELNNLMETPVLQDGTARKLLFPNRDGGWLCPSSFGNRVRRPAQQLAGWPKDEDGKFLWNFHSLRHVFCTYYFVDLKKLIGDVARSAGHASPITTLEMYIGNTEGGLDRLYE
ncbi:MAG: site-specific integrase [Streptomycetaceae bacterium]|nr:MAG: site-specific integrase [Streptomycetaceae bacterium]